MRKESFSISQSRTVQIFIFMTIEGTCSIWILNIYKINFSIKFLSVILKMGKHSRLLTLDRFGEFSNRLALLIKIFSGIYTKLVQRLQSTPDVSISLSMTNICFRELCTRSLSQQIELINRVIFLNIHAQQYDKWLLMSSYVLWALKTIKLIFHPFAVLSDVRRVFSLPTFPPSW